MMVLYPLVALLILSGSSHKVFNKTTETIHNLSMLI
jgi:hypothetical protein